MTTLSPNTTEWLTLALVVITGIYAFGTFRILKANREAVQALREQTEALLRPYITVEVSGRPGTTLLQLSVRNMGRSAAKNLTMSIDRPVFQCLDGPPMNLQELPLFCSEEPTVLSGGAELHYIIGMGYKVLTGPPEHRLPQSFIVSARYCSGDRTYDERHTVGIMPLMHSAVQAHEIGNAIDRAAKSLTETLARFKQ